MGGSKKFPQNLRDWFFFIKTQFHDPYQHYIENTIEEKHFPKAQISLSSYFKSIDVTTMT